ncbi:MAG: TetR/AcrR family transcriptional regulator [Myxococcota bacterium]|nr:TetR/AcrR family transcriptional regulator [Myxococcota bacterium]
MEERSERIVQSAMLLADKGGFQAVRLRDVAAHSGVALGTLYSRFRSKEDILVAALESETAKFETLLDQYPVMGDSAIERVTHFFTLATRALFARPNFARAVLRSVSSGVPEVAEKVLRFHRQMTTLIVASLRSTSPLTAETTTPHTEAEERVGFLLQQIWFAALVGWMGGVQDEETIVEHMCSAAGILLKGSDLE